MDVLGLLSKCGHDLRVKYLMGKMVVSSIIIGVESIHMATAMMMTMM